MSDVPTGAYVSVESGGFEISSNHATAEQITADLDSSKPPAEDPAPIDPSEAAAALGKRGGEASAEKRKADAAADADAIAKRIAAKAEAAKDPLDAEPDEPEKEQATGKRSARERVLQATRAAKEAREEAAQARADAAQARADREHFQRELESARKPVAAAARRVDSDAPQAEDFEVWDDYLAAFTDYKVQKALAERDHGSSIAQSEMQRERAIDGLIGEGAKAHAEFIASRPTFLDEVSDEILGFRPSMALGPNEQLGPDNVIADEIILSKATGPLIELHLTDHPEELERLRALQTPQQLQVEMRILARTLSAGVAAPKAAATLSKAKPPVKPITGSPSVSEEDLTGEMSFDEYVSRVSSRERARR